MSKKTSNHKNNSLKSYLRYMLVLIPVFILLLIGMGLAGNFKQASLQQTNSSAIQNGPSPVPHTTYTSQKLGISFSYIPFFPNGIGQYFYTKEINDTIYIYWQPGNSQSFSGTDDQFLKDIASQAYSVQVFTKDPQISLVDVIKQRFLIGVSKNNCIIKNYSNGQARLDKSYQTVVISAVIPHDPKLSWLEVHNMIKNCSQYADQLAGVSYFMMDPKHPDKFLFIRLGQDDISSGIGPMWDGTIKIF